MSFKNSIHLAVSIFLFGIVASFSPFVQQTQAQTSCPVTPTSQNSITNTVTISENGTYRVWSRLLAPDTANNSYYLQIDGGCAIAVGDSTNIPANQWTWVNYQDGIIGTPTQVQLTAGDHIIKLTEKEGGVGIDRIFFTQDSSCTPTGTGANCTIVNTPTPVQTVSFWPESVVPTIPSVADSGAVSLGVKFQSDVAGQIKGIRFYKGSSNTGTHTGSLWTNSGTRLATATFTNETATGWQQVEFDTPVVIDANTTYVASYFAPNGNYAGDNNYFSTAYANTPLHALSSDASGGNGIYMYGGDAFPTNSYQASNYWVDVVFLPSQSVPTATPTTSVPTLTPTMAPTNTPTPTLPADTIAPVVSITYPTNGAIVSRNATVTLQAQASDNTAVTRVEFYVNGVLKGTDSTAPYTNNWLVPNKRNTSFNLSAKAYDSAGNIGTSSTVTVRTSR